MRVRPRARRPGPRPRCRCPCGRPVGRPGAAGAVAGARGSRPLRGEAGRVDAARHDGDASSRHAHGGSSATSSWQVAMIHGDFRPTPRSRPTRVGGAGVRGTLVAALDGAERVEGLHDRDGEVAGAAQRGQARHPEVCVDQVGALAFHRRASSSPKAGIQGSRSSLGTPRGGPAGTWWTVTPGAAGPRGPGRERLCGCGR